jgi:biotin operon repressor
MKNEEIKKTTYENLIKLLASTDGYIKSEEIGKILPELKQSSMLRTVINLLRKNGYPIISGKNGYKLTDDKEEVILCIRMLQHRAKRINDAWAGMMYYFVKQPIKL